MELKAYYTRGIGKGEKAREDMAQMVAIDARIYGQGEGQLESDLSGTAYERWARIKEIQAKRAARAEAAVETK